MRSVLVAALLAFQTTTAPVIVSTCPTGEYFRGLDAAGAMLCATPASGAAAWDDITGKPAAITNLTGTNTGDQTTVSGNAGTATALQTPRNINGVSFNGTANVTVPAAGSTLTDNVPVTKLNSGTNASASTFWRGDATWATAGGGPVIVRLAADSALSTTTKTNLTGMAFTLLANTSYSWTCNMFTTANAATVGVQFAITFGGTVTAVRSLFQGPGAATTLLWSADTSFQLDHNPTASQGNVAGMVTLSGTVEVSGTGGTLQFQHGSETATLTTVQRGSWCALF